MTWAGKGAALRRGCALRSEGGEQRSQAQALAGTQAGDGAGWPQGLRAAVRKRAGHRRVGGRLGRACALTVLSVPHPVRVRCGDGEPMRMYAFSCGNGELDPGESCDDGNRLANDGCDARCVEE